MSEYARSAEYGESLAENLKRLKEKWKKEIQKNPISATVNASFDLIKTAFKSIGNLANATFKKLFR